MSAVVDSRTNDAAQPALPPHNHEVEMIVLALVLQDNALLDRLGGVGPEIFSDDLYRRIFLACIHKHRQGLPANPVTIIGDLEHNGEPDKALRRFLAQLYGLHWSALDWPHYLATLVDFHQRRQILALAADLEAWAFIDDDPAAIQIGRAARKLEEIQDAMTTVGRAVALGAALDDTIEASRAAMEAGGRFDGVPTGIRSLDHILGGGLYNSGLYLIGARPSLGKTVLGENIAENAARAGIRALFASGEMTTPQLCRRILAGATGIPAERIARGKVTAEELVQMVGAKLGLPADTLLIDDPSTLSADHVVARAREESRRRGLGLLVIDYLNVMALPAADRQDLRIDAAVLPLKRLAKELHIPVLLLAQLSREVERRENKRPQLADLRDAGQLEQHADAVIFIYRAAFYAERERPARKTGERDGSFLDRVAQWEADFVEIEHDAELIVAKNRLGGRIGTADVYFDGPRQRFQARAAEPSASEQEEMDW